MINGIGVGEAITIVTLGAGVVAWAVRLEGRINTSDARYDALQKAYLADAGETREDIQYIRERLDRVLERRGQ